MRRGGLVIALLLLAGGALRLSADGTSGDIVTRLIRLQHIAAARAAAALDKPKPPDYDELAAGRESFLKRALAAATAGVRPPRNLQPDTLMPLPERDFAEARVAQTGGGGELVAFMPEGLAAPPVAVPQQNALMVRGTALAIDKLQEVVGLIDVPPYHVNVTVELLSVTSRVADQWAAETAGRFPEANVFSRGAAAASGPTMRIGGGNVQALLSAAQSRSRASNSVEANVTTVNNTPCVIRAATLIPYVSASVSYDQFGQRRVDYTVDAVATGVELFVIPRITGQDTVTMLLRPSFIDAVGRAITPDGQALPITQQTAVETLIRVHDGETVVIGGLTRHSDALATVGPAVLPPASGTAEDSESLVLVRPRILRNPTQ